MITSPPLLLLYAIKVGDLFDSVKKSLANLQSSFLCPFIFQYLLAVLSRKIWNLIFLYSAIYSHYTCYFPMLTFVIFLYFAYSIFTIVSAFLIYLSHAFHKSFILAVSVQHFSIFSLDAFVGFSVSFFVSVSTSNVSTIT